VDAVLMGFAETNVLRRPGKHDVVAIIEVSDSFLRHWGE